MSLTPSPEKHRPNQPLPQNETFVSSFDRLCKRNEIVLNQAAAVRRDKKSKLNSLYFKSQVKDLIFYQKDEDNQQQGAPIPLDQKSSKSNVRSKSGTVEVRSVNISLGMAAVKPIEEDVRSNGSQDSSGLEGPHSKSVQMFASNRLTLRVKEKQQML